MTMTESLPTPLIGLCSLNLRCSRGEPGALLLEILQSRQGAQPNPRRLSLASAARWGVGKRMAMGVSLRLSQPDRSLIARTAAGYRSLIEALPQPNRSLIAA